MLTYEVKKQFDEIFDTLGENLDITKAQHKAAVDSYNAVGKWLSDTGSLLAPYKPIIRPQGSFMLGTMIRPINEDDDLDIDLVCELTGKSVHWTQFDLKKVVGDRLKSNATYKGMLKPEGRRCWTLGYANSSNFHMDVLPSIVSSNFKVILEKAFSANAGVEDTEALAIRITDKLENNYITETNPDNWLKSNPLGYGQWFYNIAKVETMRKTMLFSESISPVPKYSEERYPLQRIVQILKRHRDVMFDGDEHKPISIIITTLAAMSYRKETSIVDGLMSVVSRMEANIREEYNFDAGKKIRVIPNPVNPEENFADKWVEHPIREKNFYKWLSQLKQDLQLIIEKRGLQNISDVMKTKFGERATITTFSAIGDKSVKLRESGALKMASTSGMLGTVGTITAKSHNFHGKK